MAPFAGGRISPGHFVPGGGGSFTTDPIRFVDATYETSYSSTTIVERSVGFEFLNIDAVLRSQSDADAVPPINLDVPDQPQWHVDTPISGQGNLFAVAWISNEGGNADLTQFAADFPPISGLFKRISNFPGRQSASLRFTPAGAPIVIENTSIYQVRDVPFTEILAQASITLRMTFT